MLKKKTILNSNNNPVRVQFKKKQQEIKSVGNLIDAIKDADEDDLEDGNITKEIYQKNPVDGNLNSYFYKFWLNALSPFSKFDF